MLGKVVADEDAPAPNPNVTIADIFNDALQDVQLDSGAEAPAPGSALFQGGLGAPPDPMVVPLAPPPAVPDSGDDSDYYTNPMTGRRYKQDKYGENVRVTARPPYTSVADYKKMSYKQQLQAKLDY